MVLPPLIMFLPRTNIITAITNAFPAVVTTANNHLYIDGLIVRLDIPQEFGMPQANQQTGVVTVLTDTTFAISLNTTLFQPFAYPADLPMAYTPPQVVSVGEIPITVAGATQNVLPGSSL